MQIENYTHSCYHQFMNHFNQDYLANRDANGRVRIWSYSPSGGPGELLLDQPNLITKIGAGIMARSLAGLPASGVTHMYVGYSSTNTVATAANISDTVAAFGSNKIKLPLAFSPSYGATDGTYDRNISYFTAYLTDASLNGKYITHLGLVNSTVDIVDASDALFSRIVCGTPVAYVTGHGLAISWGITFKALAS